MIYSLTAVPDVDRSSYNDSCQKLTTSTTFRPLSERFPEYIGKMALFAFVWPILLCVAILSEGCSTDDMNVCCCHRGNGMRRKRDVHTKPLADKITSMSGIADELPQYPKES
ncbi:uncharacterized protein LOC117343017 [Pecten maximus]|uniref:uncharacterized protein LOC117343017 n=1 Tax=Pecten maximus TaxID=6579 RepID=UPI0014588DB1|nr:uncharacterized protein LOC117343017 [Pecten maximus]